jgi:Holliday junction resolvase
MLESAIQKKIIDRLTKEGWYVIKLIKTNKNGIPDLLSLRDGVSWFIEVKQPKGVLSEIQKFRIQELREKGFKVSIWTDYGIDFSKE